LNYCDKKKIAIVPFGGHSSVTRGVECPFGGISLDLTRHMNQVLQVNEMNGSARVQPGIFGPALETFLNHFGRGYTCGHFPQSFEFSTLGGWIATRGAGQQSTGYGKIEDIVLSMRLVTPRGILRTKDYPRKALGPEINQILIGSEGAFGVITEAVIRVRKYRPENRRYFSFLFKTWEEAVDAMREVVQSEFGFPSLLRLSDPEETEIGFKLQNLDKNLIDTGLRLLGYRSRQRCLMLGMTEGDPDQGKLIKHKVVQICKRKGGLPLGRSPVDAWFSQRYSSAYLRDPLMDRGIMTDTLETAVSWKNLIPVWEAGRRYIKSRERTICMIHISHVYETGANLYFTFLTPIQKGNEVKDYLDFQRGIIDAIQQSGGSLSHHHGIGKMLAPWMEKEIGKEGLKLYQAIKDDLDPNGIMNPGRTLGLKDQIGKRKRSINNQKSFFRKT
jgi:alkyldihydroxyacetonephosphate synthase